MISHRFKNIFRSIHRSSSFSYRTKLVDFIWTPTVDAIGKHGLMRWLEHRYRHRHDYSATLKIIIIILNSVKDTAEHSQIKIRKGITNHKQNKTTIYILSIDALAHQMAFSNLDSTFGRWEYEIISNGTLPFKYGIASN